MKKIMFLFLALALISSCCPEEVEHPLRKLMRDQFADLERNINLSCDEQEGTTTYIKAELSEGAQVCYYDSLDNRIPLLSRYNNFSTPSPSTGGPATEVTNSFGFQLFKEIVQYEHYIEIMTPHFDPNVNSEVFLDSLLSIREHLLAETPLDKSKFTIKLYSVYITFDSGGVPFGYYSKYGKQPDGKVIIHKATKIRDGDKLYYDVDISFDCKLYYNPDETRVGFWRDLTNGMIKGRFLVFG